MKIKIVAEDKRLGRVEIPLTHKEIAAFFDLGYMIEDDTWKVVKLNKIDKSITSLHKKIDHVLNGVYHRGRVYKLITKNGKTKTVLNDKPIWSVKKPNWKK